MTNNTSIVLFSGGRDSSLAACLEARATQSVVLLTAQTGATIPTTVSDIREDEIRQAFPLVQFERVRPHAAGIFRRLAIADIESDFARHGTNLILLGHQMAIQCEGIIEALRRGGQRVVSGFSHYQSPAFMEQTPEAIAITKRFFREYSLEFAVPIAKYETLDDVKFALLDFGVTTKSLEAVSLFADSFSPPRPGAIEEYMESKLDTCRAYIDRRAGGRGRA